MTSSDDGKLFSQFGDGNIFLQPVFVQGVVFIPQHIEFNIFGDEFFQICYVHFNKELCNFKLIVRNTDKNNALF